MWSAPKQPFVLPVRVRSFEYEYSDEVKTEGLDQIYETAPALGIKKAIQQKLNSLAESLRQKIMEQKTIGLNVKEITDNGVFYIGIYSGQLYHLVKDIKPVDELRNENQLMPLLTNILLKNQMIILNEDGKKYYSAEKKYWGDLLD